MDKSTLTTEEFERLCRASGVCSEPASQDDPWAHRSHGMRCRTCMFFVPKETQVEPGVRGKLGRCRRHAPTINGFPVVFESDWCGDHRLDEEKA